MNVKRPSRATINQIGMLVAVLFTVFAALSTASFNARLADNDRVRAAEQMCTTTTLFGAILALNERTTFSRDQNDANIQRLEAQAEFLRVFVRDGLQSGADAEEALNVYFSNLNRYIDLVQQTQDKQLQYAYPEQANYLKCLQDAQTVADR